MTPGALPVLGVLIVDDCPDTTDSMALLVRMWGHRVHSANDGPTALRLAEQHCPDVVLLDLGMPRMNGWEVARQLRKILGLQEALVVAISGYAFAADQRRSLEAGCDRHLSKPVSPELIRELLATRAKEIHGHVSGELDTTPYRTGEGG